MQYHSFQFVLFLASNYWWKFDRRRLDYLTVKLTIAFDGKLSLISQVVCHTRQNDVNKLRNVFEKSWWKTKKGNIGEID